MTVTYGDIVFDVIRYDPEHDNLILHSGPERPGDDWDQSDEGDALRFKDGALIGVDMFDFTTRLERGDAMTITLEDGTVLRPPDVHLALRATAA